MTLGTVPSVWRHSVRRGWSPFPPKRLTYHPSNSEQDCAHFSGIMPGLHRLWTIFASRGECCILRLPILFLPLQSSFSSLHPLPSPQSYSHFVDSLTVPGLGSPDRTTKASCAILRSLLLCNPLRFRGPQPLPVCNPTQS